MPVSLHIDLYPGVIIVTVAPPGHIDLPGGNAHGPEGGDAEGGLLAAATQAAVVACDGVHGSVVCGFIGHLPGAPPVDCQGCLPSRQPLYLRGYHLGEKTPAIHQILGVPPGIKHVVEENVLGHIPAVGGALPQAQGVTGVAQKHVKGNAGHIRGGEGPQGQLHEAPFISGEPVQLPLGGPAGFAQILLCRLPALPGKAADVIT